MFEVRGHPKFRECNTASDLEEYLKSEIERSPSVIPYRFTFFTEYPGFSILGYITPSKKFVREFVKIKPKGFLFHEKYLPNVNSLISFFKENFSSIEYRKYVKHFKEPKIVTTDEIIRKK